MDTAKLRPALDFSRVMKLKDRLEAADMMTGEEKDALYRVLMFYGKFAIKTLE